MSLQTFYKNFGLEPDINIEKGKFVQRINQTIFYTVQRNSYMHNYENIFMDVCYQLGINGRKMVENLNRNNYGSSVWVPGLEKITNGDFIETLKVLVLLYNSVSDEYKQKVSLAVELAFSQSVVDLGIRWKDGMFYPSGAKELDDKLINDNLDWLEKYPETKMYY